MKLCGKICYRRTDHRWEYNTVHGHCILSTKCYKHTLRIRNTDHEFLDDKKTQIYHHAHDRCTRLNLIKHFKNSVSHL